MSGGPLLDEQGRLVGINGQGLRDVRTEAIDFFGIPINIYLKFASMRPSTPVATVSQPPINRQYYPQTRRINSVTNISDYLIASSKSNSSPDNSFTYLNKALEASGLKDTLRMQGSFTLFAPTDAAIAKLPKNTMQDLLKPENKEVLVKILKYHIVYGKLLRRNLRTGDLKSSEGQNISVKVNSASVVTVNDARLIQTESETSNGVIHVIDALILPPDL
ncbi:MAG: fasciclin domain-containing protein [Brasilonema octagenarum HA4186-MV1]|nr:fasciclin domain-containing protein [Brasilonema octagenarum HA4186-MV1]